MDKQVKRILMSIFGVVICGVSVGFFKRATFGVDPFQSLISGLCAVLPISYGTVYVLANACLLLFALINDRRKIGIATLINLFLLGYIADFSHQLLNTYIPEADIGARVLLFLIGIVVMCLASAFYFTADLGVSTYDAVSLILSEKRRAPSFRCCRIASDFVCVALGVALYLLSGQALSGLAGMVGIGTIVTAFCMGPLIDYFNVHVAQPFLNS